MPTIDEIAKRANVSKTTVSFVINGRPGPSAETVAHVRRVMAEMNYVPSLLAQRFAAQQSKTVALVVLPYPHVFSDVRHGQALDAVYETLEAAGYSLLLATSSAKFIEERRYDRMLRSGHVDGMLLLEPTLDQGYLGELAADDAAAVIINADGQGIGLDYVRTDDHAVGCLAAEHLLKNQHRRIGFIAASPNHASARDRARGFLKTLEEAGAPVSPHAIFSGSYDTSYWSGYQGCEQILRDAADITALFCSNDTMALGAIEAAHRNGRAVPRDLSIIGVDDVPAASYSNPPLTTFQQPSHEVARKATQTLLDRLMSKSPGPRNRVQAALAPTLVERESVAPPATNSR
jgi:LacI family transcriptional regulator